MISGADRLRADLARRLDEEVGRLANEHGITKAEVIKNVRRFLAGALTDAERRYIAEAHAAAREDER